MRDRVPHQVTRCSEAIGREAGIAVWQWQELTHGALREIVAPCLHGLGDFVPVGVDIDSAVIVGHENGKGQILDGRIGPWEVRWDVTIVHKESPSASAAVAWRSRGNGCEEI